MSRRNNSTGDQPLRETEDAAYNAFREWHVFLVLRKKELEAHHAPAAIQANTPEVAVETISPAPPVKSPKPVQPEIKSPTPALASEGIAELPLTRIEWSGGT